MLAGKGKENQRTMPEHKTKTVTDPPPVKGGNTPLKQHTNYPNCD